jgi:hypothetical protein
MSFIDDGEKIKKWKYGDATKIQEDIKKLIDPLEVRSDLIAIP